MVYFQVGRWAGNAGGLCRRVGGRNFDYWLSVIGRAQPRPTSTPQGGGIGIPGGGAGNPGTYIGGGPLGELGAAWGPKGPILRVLS